MGGMCVQLPENIVMSRTRTKTELRRFSEIHPDLQAVVKEAEKTVEFYIVCGHRNEVDQFKAFMQKKSKLSWPKSKHNKAPSEAVDLCPWPIDWEDVPKFVLIYTAMVKAAKKLGIKVRCGADFDSDGNLKNDKFRDLPHFELKT